jgi:uncharacterized protein YraI
VVEATRVNLREGPSERFPSLGLYERGTTFYVIGKTPSGEWLQVLTLDEQVGWVFAANLTLNADLAGVPVAEAPPTPTLLPPTAKPKPTPQAPQAPQVPPTNPPALPPTNPPAPPPTDPPPPTPTKKPDDDDRPDKPKPPPDKPPPPPDKKPPPP